MQNKPITHTQTGQGPNTLFLDRITFGLLIFMAFGSFVLSYVAMWYLALDAGIDWRLAWLWPLVTESGIVVFSLALLRARLHGDDSKSLYWLVIACAVLSVVFNVAHAPDDTWLTWGVFALPPIFLLLSFKTLLWQIERDNQRAVTVEVGEISEKVGASVQKMNQIRTSKKEQRRAGVLEMHHDGATVKEMAQRFDVTERTIKSDLRALNGSVQHG